MVTCLEAVFDISQHEFDVVATFSTFKKQGFPALYIGNFLRDIFYYTATDAAIILLQSGYSYEIVIEVLQKKYDCGLPELATILQNERLLHRAEYTLEFGIVDPYHLDHYHYQLDRIFKSLGISIRYIDEFIPFFQLLAFTENSNTEYYKSQFFQLNFILEHCYKTSTVLTKDTLDNCELFNTLLTYAPNHFVITEKTIFLSFDQVIQHLENAGYGTSDIMQYLEPNIEETSALSVEAIKSALLQTNAEIATSPISLVVDHLINDYGVTTGKKAYEVLHQLLPISQDPVAIYQGIVKEIPTRFPYYTCLTRIESLRLIKPDLSLHQITVILKEVYHDLHESANFLLTLYLGFDKIEVTNTLLQIFQTSININEALEFYDIDVRKANELFYLISPSPSQSDSVAGLTLEPDTKMNLQLQTFASSLSAQGITADITFGFYFYEYLWVLAGHTSTTYEDIRIMRATKQLVLDDLVTLAIRGTYPKEVLRKVAKEIYGVSSDNEASINHLLVEYREKHYAGIDLTTAKDVKVDKTFVNRVIVFLQKFLEYDTLSMVEKLIGNDYGPILTMRILYYIDNTEQEIKASHCFQTLFTNNSPKKTEWFFNDFSYYDRIFFRYLDIAFTFKVFDKSYTLRYAKTLKSIPYLMLTHVNRSPDYTTDLNEDSIFKVYRAMGKNDFVTHDYLKVYIQEKSPIHEPTIGNMVAIGGLYLDDSTLTMPLTDYIAAKTIIAMAPAYMKAWLTQYFFAYDPPGFDTIYSYRKKTGLSKR